MGDVIVIDGMEWDKNPVPAEDGFLCEKCPEDSGTVAVWFLVRKDSSDGYYETWVCDACLERLLKGEAAP